MTPDATVRTTYFAVAAGVDSDPGDPNVGIVRYQKEFVPKVADRNVAALAPPESLLNPFKTVEESATENDEDDPTAIAWTSVKYEEKYREHLDGKRQQAAMNDLRDALRDRRDVMLVCYCKDWRYCHRRLLAEELAASLEDLDVAVEHHPDREELEAADEADEAADDLTHANLADFQGESA